MKHFILAMIGAAALHVISPAKAAETCVEAGKDRICADTVNTGLNIVTSISVTVPPDAALEVIDKYGVKDKSLLYACRITANNREAQKSAVFGKAPGEVIARMNGAQFVGGDLLPDRRINCKFEARTLRASSGPYESMGSPPERMQPCMDKLVSRTNSTGLTVKKQTTSTLFYETEHSEFTAACALQKDAVTGAISGPKLCKPSIENMKPLMDMVGAPDKDRKKLVQLSAEALRKTKKGGDPVVKWGGYEISAGLADPDCMLIMYGPDSENKS